MPVTSRPNQSIITNTFINEVARLVISDTNPAEITTSQSDFLNSLPVTEIATALQELLEQSTDSFVRSRAFDALLKLEGFDRVKFLIDLAEKDPDSWSGSCSRELSSFQDARAIVKLCELLTYSSDPDVRFDAAESLAVIGDESAVKALEDAMKSDFGTDYEGFRVSDRASLALQKIKERIAKLQ